MTSTSATTMDNKNHSQDEAISKPSCLKYSAEEGEQDCTSSSTSTTEKSLTELDVTGDDFWNMTLDDLEDFSFAPSQLKPRSTRRGSDGFLASLAKQSNHNKNDKGGTTTTTRPRRKTLPGRIRNVSFGKVQVRECERVLGDNPSCSEGGPSLSIGWKVNKEKVVELDAWEAKRQKERRSHSKLLLSSEKREKIAKKNGFTKKDIQENVKSLAKWQRRRERTRLEAEKECLVGLLAQSRDSAVDCFFRYHANKKNDSLLLSV